MLTKQETLLGTGVWVESSGLVNPENCSVTSLAHSGLMVIEPVSGLSLANHSDSGADPHHAPSW